jgi:catechol 2,3-dioxygenase-like lactoylglutathione lyase family enzyme
VSVSIDLLVLYVADIEASRGFYELLGLEFVREKHGDGPVHYAAELPGGMVLELYPAPTGVVSRVRIGLTVPDQDAAVARLRAAGATVKRSDLAIDPDGNRVLIREM